MPVKHRPPRDGYYEVQYRIDLPDVSYWCVHLRKDTLEAAERSLTGAKEGAPGREWRIVQCMVIADAAIQASDAGAFARDE